MNALRTTIADIPPVIARRLVIPKIQDVKYHEFACQLLNHLTAELKFLRQSPPCQVRICEQALLRSHIPCLPLKMKCQTFKMQVLRHPISLSSRRPPRPHQIYYCRFLPLVYIGLKTNFNSF